VRVPIGVAAWHSKLASLDAASPQTVLQLQRQYGNRALQSLTQRAPRSFIQRQIDDGTDIGDPVKGAEGDTWTVGAIVDRAGKRYYTLFSATGGVRENVPADTTEFSSGQPQTNPVALTVMPPALPVRPVTMAAAPAQVAAPPQAAPLLPPWNTVTGVEYYDSGNGGAFGVTFAAHRKQVVKGAYPSEVAGSRLAARMGLLTPGLRMVTAGSDEFRSIQRAIEQSGQYQLDQAVRGRSLLLVLDFVNERTLSQALEQRAINPGEAVLLAPELGKWFAFHLLIRDIDNFGLFQFMNSRNVNSSNFFVGAEAHRGRLVGVDQNVSASGGDKAQTAIAAIKRRDEQIASDAVGNLAQQLDVDIDQLAPGFLRGAQEGLDQIRQTIEPQAITAMANEIDLPAEMTEALLTVLATIRQ
jgi:hypothetical protein